jgi:hypothetical protein
MGRRLPLLLAAMFVVAGAAWFLDGRSTSGDPGLVHRSPAGETTGRGEAIPTRDTPTAEDAARDPLEVTAAAVVPPPEDDVLRVGVLLVAGDTKQPLAGYHVQALPVGTSPLVSPGRRSPWVTDRDGRVAIGDLDGDGPWDIHAWPVDWGGSGFDPWAESRVGSARPTRSGVWSRFEVKVGPTVIYRGGLPPGVRAEDLIIEAQATISPRSSMLGGSGGTATARSTDEGFALARIRPIMNTMQEDGFIVRAVTRDGLWSTMRIEPGRLSNRSVVHLDEPLQPRGKVAVRIEFDPPGGEHDAEAAVRWIRWSLPLAEPPPAGAPAAPTAARGPWNAGYHPVGGDVFELHDLPLGSVEFRAPAGDSPTSLPAEAGKTLSIPSGGAQDPKARSYSLAAPVRVDAVHGPPTPRTLRLRWSR